MQRRRPIPLLPMLIIMAFPFMMVLLTLYHVHAAINTRTSSSIFSTYATTGDQFVTLLRPITSSLKIDPTVDYNTLLLSEQRQLDSANLANDRVEANVLLTDYRAIANNLDSNVYLLSQSDQYRRLYSSYLDQIVNINTNLQTLDALQMRLEKKYQSFVKPTTTTPIPTAPPEITPEMAQLAGEKFQQGVDKFTNFTNGIQNFTNTVADWSNQWSNMFGQISSMGEKLGFGGSSL